MARYLVRLPKGQPGVWVTKRDYDVFKQTGWAVMPDLVRVESQYVIVEMDEGKTRPVALCKDNPGKSYRKDHFGAIRRALSKSRSDRAVRLSDLVTLDIISKRTGRHATTILARWMSWPGWPAPLLSFGQSRVWSWPEVRQAIVKRGLPIVRKGVRHNGETVEGNRATRHRPKGTRVRDEAGS